MTGVCMYVCMPGPYQHGRPGAVHLIVSISDSRLNTQTDRQTDTGVQRHTCGHVERHI